MSSYSSFIYGHHPLYYPYSNGSTDYHVLTGPSGYSPLGDGYSHGIYLHPYPNTLRTRINWDAFSDQSHLKVDPATLPIVPEYLMEAPQQLDNSHHDLNPRNGFYYHVPDEPKQSNTNISSLNTGSSSLLLLSNEIFTSPMNFQYILPNGRTGEIPVTWKRPDFSKPLTTKQANDIIYNAKKARGDTDIRDSIGNSYDPNQPQRAINDGLDFVDESLLGQINYFYSITDPRLINLPTQIAIDNYKKEVLMNGENFNTAYPTGLPQSKEYLRSQATQQYLANNGITLPNNQTNSGINYQQPLTNVFTSSGGNQFPTLNSVYDNSQTINRVNPFDSLLQPQNLQNVNYQHLVNPSEVYLQVDPILNQSFPLQNAFATNLTNTKQANNSTKSVEGTINDFTGTTHGEFQHILEFMQKSLADITKVKVPYVGLNGSPVPQSLADPALTGRIPVIDPLSQAYSWMALSPDYQRYVDYHIRDVHGGVHDVFTPRGYQPSQLFAGGMIGLGNNLQSNIPELYKSPAFIPPTITNPLADYRLLTYKNGYY